jgi:tetratricopeptide (TPR) repeat protein
VLAVLYQLFSLPDQASHLKTIELIINAPFARQTRLEQDKELVRALDALSQDHLPYHICSEARQVAKQLLHYMESRMGTQERLATANALLEDVLRKRASPSKTIAAVYSARGQSHLDLRQYQQAIADLNRALELDPENVSAYCDRGWTYVNRKEYPQAIADFDHALELDPNNASAYSGRGWTYVNREEYPQAIADFDRALELDPGWPAAYNGRGYIHELHQEYQQTLALYERYIKRHPKEPWGYYYRGRTYRGLKSYQQAMEDFNRAIELGPDASWLYWQRGLAYLWLKDIKLASADFLRGWELDWIILENGWMVEWSIMCQERPDVAIPERLETIARFDPQDATAQVCHAVALWFCRLFTEALGEIEKAISSKTGRWSPWNPYFWKGMICASLKRDVEAVDAIEKSLELGLPPILLLPLHWWQLERPDFYETFVLPLLARYQ